METQDELKRIEAVANSWLGSDFDEETRAAVKQMLEAEDKTLLIDSFYRTLEFGTGGLRGKMGPGTNRMNKYIVAQATQGFANYLNKVAAEGGFANIKGRRVRCQRHTRLSFREPASNTGSQFCHPSSRLPRRCERYGITQPERV